MKKKSNFAKKRGTNGNQKKAPVNASNISVEDVLATAEATMETNVEKAIQLYTSAASMLRAGKSTTAIISRERQLVQVLEKLGEAHVGMGDPEDAQQAFEQAIALLEEEESAVEKSDTYYHETRSSLYLYIGQLCTGDQALQAFLQGVSSLESCIALVGQAAQDEMVEAEETPNTKLLPELQKKLSGAYCTVAELYLTDLCFEEHAETECESVLQKALQIKDEADGQPIIDALQTMASLRLSQQGERRQEAVSYILQAYAKIKVGSEALASLVGLDGNQDDDDDDDVKKESPQQALELQEVDAANSLPEFEFRCQTAKLLVECAALLNEESNSTSTSSDKKPTTPNPQEQLCIQAAISVLGSLLAQNDEVVEIWFLTGCAFYAKKNDSAAGAARYYFQRTMEMLVDIRKALQQEAKYTDADDEDEQQDIQAQLEENETQIEDTQAKLDELGANEDDDEEDDDGDEEDDDMKD
jgi:tetratricopeptide (TPR) repeat protein